MTPNPNGQRSLVNIWLNILNHSEKGGLKSDFMVTDEVTEELSEHHLSNITYQVWLLSERSEKGVSLSPQTDHF